MYTNCYLYLYSGCLVTLTIISVLAHVSSWHTNFLNFFDSVFQFGHIVLTTSAGIMDHDEARRKNVGGKVLGFFY